MELRKISRIETGPEMNVTNITKLKDGYFYNFSNKSPVSIILFSIQLNLGNLKMYG